MAGNFGLVITPYSGPRPSPARRWAPFVILAAVALAFVNAVLLVLNLIERHYQQQRGGGQYVSQSTIHDTVSLIRTVSRLSIAIDVAFLVVAIVWATKRRTRSRLAMGGEASVEASFRS